jgi:chromosome segregation ATPase
VATPETLDPSQRLQKAALAERKRLERRLGDLERNLEELRLEQVRLEREHKEIEGRLELLVELTGDERPKRTLELIPPAQDSETAPESLRGTLRGAAIREVAVRLHASQHDPLRPIHYTDWYALFRRAGYRIEARNQLATFLTQISRSPVVAKAAQSGTYALDLGAPKRLQDRLATLHQELAALHKGQQTIEHITSIRDRRSELGREISRVERELLEAAGSLGLEPEEVGGP